MQASSYAEGLLKNGLINLSPPFDSNTIKKWNDLMNPLFEAQAATSRSYINASELLSMGILEEVFNPAMRSLLRTLMPDAVLYHCHAYEIKANQTSSHIHQGSNLGWHRDEECMAAFRKGTFHHLSLFIYLTDVGVENGPFEFAPQSPTKAAKSGMPTLKMLGKAGTTFYWNRAYRHRACPNVSNTRRRLLKLSVQNNDLPNDRINLPEFKEVLDKVNGKDPYLAHLFGAHYPENGVHHELPTMPTDTSIGILPFTPNANLEVSFMGLVKMNYIKTTYNRIKEMMGKSVLEPH